MATALRLLAEVIAHDGVDVSFIIDSVRAQSLLSRARSHSLCSSPLTASQRRGRSRGFDEGLVERPLRHRSRLRGAAHVRRLLQHDFFQVQQWTGAQLITLTMQEAPDAFIVESAAGALEVLNRMVKATP